MDTITKFQWTEEYGVGVASIDEQHKHFFEITNNIFDLADSESFSADNLFNHASELGNYALYHLETEEKYFKELNYPDSESHIAAHQSFRERSVELLDAVRAASENQEEMQKLVQEMAQYCGEWLKQHILSMDKAYAAFFKEHGVA